MASSSSPSAIQTVAPIRTPSQQSKNNQQEQLAIDLNNSNQNSNMQQHQQQELIRLLAQHLQHQFYQSFTASDQQQQIQQQQQQQQHPYHHAQFHPHGIDRINPLLLNRPGAFDFSLLATARQMPARNSLSPIESNNMGSSAINSSSAPNRLLHNRLLQTSSGAEFSTNTSSSNTNQQNYSNNNIESSPTTNLLDFANIATQSTAYQNSLDSSTHSQAPHPMTNNQVNLLSALGLNLTNNQLVSLHQHQHQHQRSASLFPTAARHYGSSASIGNSEVQLRNHLHQAAISNNNNTSIQRTRLNSNNNQTDSTSNHHDQPSSDMLKFSINTILGRNSNSPSNELNELNSANKSLEDLNQILRNGNTLLSTPATDRDGEIRQGVSAPSSPAASNIPFNNCDDESSRESNSTQNSFAVASPQSNNQQNSINLYLQNSAHSSATNLNSHQTEQASSHKLSATNPSTLTSHQATQALPGLGNRHMAHHPHLTPFLTGSAAFPWTVAARGKPRRGMMRRAVFSDSQRVGLEKRFQSQKYISKPDRKKLAEKLGLRDSQVKIWFQNRRMKWRNSKERELLSAGGSREQTLPTRNNPNPDLSDVGETIKRLQTATPSSACAAAPSTTTAVGK